jgi:calcineurin-like phosphoesterase family protein
MIYFTADEHIDHKRICELMNRPFQNLDEMKETLIANHNSIVTDKDIVYHLGDVSFSSADDYIKRLNGTHHLVLGNHDYTRLKHLTLFKNIQDVLYLRTEGIRVFMSHYAHRTWRNSHYGSYHLFGHSHGMIPNYGRSMDVGVDCHNFKPISLEYVVEALRKESVTLHHPEI